MSKKPRFLLGNKPSNKRSERKYTRSIKSRNFFSNISYAGINKQDFYIDNFVFDVYLLMTKNLNPFSLDKKLNDPNKHEMIHMLWKECMPVAFYKFICKGEKFIYLNGNVLQPKVSQIITNF